MQTLDPRSPADIESFLVTQALRRRSGDTPDNVEHVDTGPQTPTTASATPRAQGQLAVIHLAGDRRPYGRHKVILSRGHSGRLHVEIESYLVNDNVTPGRIEMGPVAKCAQRLQRIGLDPAGLHDHVRLPKIEDWFEYRDEFRIGFAATASTPLPAPTGRPHGYPIDLVEG